MTDPAASEPAGLPVQPSLLHPLDELALIPPGLVPDPEVMVQFITGADAGGTAWHAIERRRAEHVSTQAAGGVTVAVCGALARVTSHGVYDRAARPVAYGPCQVCAWTVAIATGSMERELRLTRRPVGRRHGARWRRSTTRGEGLPGGAREGVVTGGGERA